jgi:hypothetical protein
MRCGWFVGAVIGCAGCIASDYAQHRAALVPHDTPMSTDGQPLDAVGMIGLGASSVADAIKPRENVSNVGDAVPNTQLRSELSLRAQDNWSITAAYENGLAATAHPVTTTQPPVDHGSVAGAGIGIAYSIEVPNSRLRVALSTEMLLWSVPWVEYTSCIASCYGRATTTTRGRDYVPTFAAAITPSYRFGAWTVFGGITVRNQPTVAEKIETDAPSSDADVGLGEANATLDAGVEYAITGLLDARLAVYQTVTRDPIASGPGVGVMVRMPLGRDVPPSVVR